MTESCYDFAADDAIRHSTWHSVVSWPCWTSSVQGSQLRKEPTAENIRISGRSPTFEICSFVSSLRNRLKCNCISLSNSAVTNLLQAGKCPPLYARWLAYPAQRDNIRQLMMCSCSFISLLSLVSGWHLKWTLVWRMIIKSTSCLKLTGGGTHSCDITMVCLNEDFLLSLCLFNFSKSVSQTLNTVTLAGETFGWVG